MSTHQRVINRFSQACCEPLDRRLLLAAGDYDSSFGVVGIATIQFPGTPFTVADVALQADGKIIVAGAKGTNMALARLNANGSIDTTFASGGLFESNAASYALHVVVQPSGKIVFSTNNLFAQVMRLTAGGSQDSSFGSSGSIILNGGTLQNLAVQQDGKIIAVANNNSVDFMIARLTVDGTLDTSFDGDGYQTAGFGADEGARAIAIDYNGTPATNPLYGTIVVVGNKFASGVSDRIAICRMLSSGAFDNSFDGDGKLTSPDLSPQPGEYATGVLIQPGGKIVVTGTALAIGGGNEVGDLLLARYLSNGALDTSFGPYGTGVYQLDLGGDDRAADMALSLAGGFLVSGLRDGGAVVAAYTANGLLDPRFSGDGLITPGFLGLAHLTTTLDAIAPVRRLLITGGSFVVRYVDIASTVTLGAGQTDTNEATGPTLNVFVSRNDPAPVPLRVYLSFGGSATPPFFGLPNNWDYNVSGITPPGLNVPRGYIDIPAGQAFTTFSVTPVNDTRAEGDETIVISISTDPTYDIGSPSGTTLVIRDDDVVGGPTVVSAEFLYETAQRVTFRFNQNVASSVGPEDFSVIGAGGAVPFSFAHDNITNTSTLSFNTILPNGNYTARAIAAGVTNGGGAPMSADYLLPFFTLAGDANRDRVVDISDLAILATNWQLSPRTFSQGDCNYDGMVDISDLAILATNWQKNLPAPAPAMARRDVAPPAAVLRRPIEQLNPPPDDLP